MHKRNRNARRNSLYHPRNPYRYRNLEPNKLGSNSDFDFREHQIPLYIEILKKRGYYSDPQPAPEPSVIPDLHFQYVDQFNCTIYDNCNSDDPLDIKVDNEHAFLWFLKDPIGKYTYIIFGTPKVSGETIVVDPGSSLVVFNHPLADYRNYYYTMTLSNYQNLSYQTQYVRIWNNPYDKRIIGIWPGNTFFDTFENRIVGESFVFIESTQMT